MSEPMLREPLGDQGLDVVRYAGPAGIPRLQLTITRPGEDPGVATLDPTQVAQLGRACARFLRYAEDHPPA